MQERDCTRERWAGTGQSSGRGGDQGRLDLEPDALARARRVARRWVVVKDGAPGWDLARLDLAPLPSARWAKRLYARVGPA